jgi:hypothetical protein
MNNYMRRFPAWNHSSVFASSSSPPLPLFSLLNEQELEPAAHGVCNMGVLLFDTHSLAAFLAQLSSPELMRAVQPHCRDRFLDSLCFVLAVNWGGIRVESLSVDLNYFVLLEEEVAAAHQTGLIPPPAPRMAHFMADSSLELHLHGEGESEAGSSCSCVLNRDHPFSANSLIAALVAQLCTPLCQLHQPYPRMSSNPLSADAAAIASWGTTAASAPSPGLLRVLWPEEGVVLLAQLRTIRLHVVVGHSALPGDGVGALNLQLSDVDSYSVLGVHTECGEAHASASNLRSSSSPSCETALQVEAVLSAARRRDLSFALTLAVTLTASEHEEGASMRAAVMLKVIAPHLLPAIHVGFKNLHQHHQQHRPHSLASQLELAHMLNARDLRDVGVVLCCDTEAGLRATARLIREWGHSIQADRRGRLGGLNGGRVLVIAVQGGHPGVGALALARQLAGQCDARVAGMARDGLDQEHLLVR